MASNIVLKTFKGGNVTPQDDAIIYQTAVPGAGIFKGCEVTVARGNVLHISRGFGMIKGRFFEVYENEISVQLADTGATLKGRVYIHLDLSNADEPIAIKAITTDVLPSLDMDSNINYNNSIYDLELAYFTVDATSIQNLTQTFSILQGGSGGGGGTGGASVTRETTYSVGDTATCTAAPGWATLVCTQAGITATIEPKGYSQITKSGDKVLDGTCVFEARNTFGEIDDLMVNLADAKDGLLELKTKFEASQTDVGELVMRLLSISEYKTIAAYDSNTMYYCYEDENTKQITAIYLGKNTIFATGIEVTYHIDSDYAIKQLASLSNEVISSAPEASLDGYEFVGWREDNTANKAVLSKKVIDSDQPVKLYAVFKRDIEIDMLDNGATLIAGKEESHFTDVLYYNNGNAKSEGIVIPECPYEMEGKSFCGWNTDCYSTPSYKPGKKGTFSDDSILFPMFVDTVYDFPYTGSYTRFVIPADGIYECELWGASGGDAVSNFSNQNTKVAKGGKGGHVKAYKEFKKGDVLFVMNGGKPNGNTGGVNGGGYGYSYSSSSTQRHFGAGGGGATHIALSAGAISTSNPFITYANRDKMLLIAGGGGGGGISNATSSAEGTYHNGGDGGGDRGGDGSSGTTFGGRQTSTGSTEEAGFLKTYSYSGGSNTTYSGGGGGWFCGQLGNLGNSGAGGSGYVGGMPTFTKDKVLYRAINEAGVNEGNGYSFIRYVKCV